MAWLLFVLQYLTVPVLIAWHAWRVEPSPLVWATRTVAIGAYTVAVALVGAWLLVPWYVAWLLLVPWAAASALSWFRRNARVSSRSLNVTRWLRLATWAVLFGASAALIAQAFRAHQPFPQEAADVSFPLRGGTYAFANGGSNELLNGHFKTRDPKYSRYRGQTYAADLIKLNRSGHHASTLVPRALADYEIFDEPVYAPCAGEVRQSASDRPDFLPPERDRTHLEGNFVLLGCGGFDVFMGHFAKGSVTVKPGALFPIDADPLPITFDGKHYARNDRITVPEAQASSPGVARW